MKKALLRLFIIGALVMGLATHATAERTETVRIGLGIGGFGEPSSNGPFGTSHINGWRETPTASN